MAPLPGPQASRREWIGLAVIALPCLLYAMDLSVLNLAIPAITADLKPSAAQMLWIVDIYGFLVAGSLITMGTLGDRIGRRRLLMIGAAAFGVASVLAALSHSANMLIAARALLGVAGATLAPSTLSLIRNMFHDPHERRIAIGVWIASFSTGGAIGPLLGGVVLAHFSWQAVFLLAVPVMVLLLVLGPLLLPEFRDPHAGRLDIASAALSMAAVLSIIFGMKRMAEHGVTPLGLLAMATGLLLGALFVVRQQRLAVPLIDLALLRRPGFGAALLINILSFFAMFAAFLYEAQYLQLVLGMAPLQAGLWTLPSALGFIAGSFVVPLLVRRLGTPRVMVGGLVMGALGFAMISQVDTQALALLVAGTVVFALGLSPVVALTTDVVISTAPPERTGAASALSETSSEFGGALGIAVLGSVAAAIYRNAMADALPPGLSAMAIEAARSTVGGALALAAQWPEPAGPALQGAARLAFVQGLRACAALSALIMVAAAFLAAATLQRQETASPISPG
ncbi:MAG: MFS transporter [Ramlibacter sp.]|nr:MFS transporter [Ramlibacter sp.]